MEIAAQPETKSKVKDFVKAILSAVASIFLAFLLPSIPGLVHGFGVSSEKAVGLAAVAGGLMETALSLWFWPAFLLSFSWFYAAGRFTKPSLRTALFWIPAIAISVLGLGFWIGFALLLSRVKMQ